MLDVLNYRSFHTSDNRLLSKTKQNTLLSRGVCLHLTTLNLSCIKIDKIYKLHLIGSAILLAPGYRSFRQLKFHALDNLK